jgi:hypothetical protein
MESLVEFDGDTVTVVINDNAGGIAIDVETEAGPQRLYEVDLWGLLESR